MSTSGWCAEFGRGHHSSCRALVCQCPCHIGETPPIRTVNVDGFGGVVRDNGGSSKDAPAGAANTCWSGANRPKESADAN